MRIHSIDVFRALTMLLMLWVNDFWTLTGVPKWLEHASASEDYLGFSDIIFPCFLFIVGMSIPFAIDRRIAKGEDRWQITYHILTRTLALLVMGVFSVNAGDLDPQASGISQAWFVILMVLGFFLIWNDYPKVEGMHKWLVGGLKGAGLALLVFLAWRFRTGPEQEVLLTGLTPRWWGILGLIGWAYAGSSLVYLFGKDQPSVILTAWVMVTLWNIASHAGWLASWPAWTTSWLVGDGAFHSFALAGTVASLLLHAWADSEHQKLMRTLLGLSAFMLVAGIISHQYFIVSKIQATPPWIFYGCAIAFAAYAGLRQLVDLRGKQHWFAFIEPAGSSTLTCYLLPYWYYKVVLLLGIGLPAVLTQGVLGLCTSMLYALLIVFLTGLLGKVGVRLKI